MKSVKRVSVISVTVSVLLAALIFFFLGQVYELSVVVQIGISIFALAIFILTWRESVFTFLLVTLTLLSVYLALEVSFALPLFLLIVFSLIAAGVVWFVYTRMRGDDSFALLLLLVFVGVWIILAFNVSYRHDWVLENILTVPFVVLIFVMHYWFKLSKTSYTLIYLFMTLHIFGSHYTYSEVPLGFWMAEFFGLARNHYDRIVHFSFGLLLAYPVREVFIRIGSARGWWAVYGPVEMVFGFSAIYEILEWLIAVIFGGDLGVAYLGTQGDVWDAQKDMVLAGIGSIIAMIITMITLFVYRGQVYWSELRESLRVKQRQALGEKAIEKMQKR